MTEEGSQSSSRIHVLDEATINKIAAGEVVERPASVVKELLDNSIDAGATEIRVEVKGAGTDLIMVTDNGKGMSREDSTLAFTKHATSKILHIDDLEKVLTLGFRGEALSSIAAVAKVYLTTRQKDSISGTKVVVSGGSIENVLEVGAAPGTTIAVESLFYNTPARKKYLKSMRTELAHITDVVTRHAFGHPEISFTLISDGKVLVRSPTSGDIFDSIVYLLGSESAKKLIPVEFKSDIVKISGYISKPELSRSGTDLQYFFINGRGISSKSISNAVRLGYYNLMPKGRFPASVLDLELDLSEVDVNVHPAKRYVRMSHEREVCDAVTLAVENALKVEQLVPEISLPEKKPVQAVFVEKAREIPEEKLEDISKAEAEVQIPQEKFELEVPVPEKKISPLIKEEEETYHFTARDTEKRLKHSERVLSKTPKKPERAPTGLDKARIVGQVNELYIIVELEDGLVIVDQHAAHERVMYEQICNISSSGWQELITPVTLDLTSKEKVLLEEYIPYLEEMGFAISEFGPNSYVVTTVPALLGKMESAELIHDIIIDLLSTGRVKNDTGMFDNLCKTMACRAAIKAGAGCSMGQMESLLKQLDMADNPYTCPHGRPTMISFSRAELDKLFKRTG
ncbi:DNA mismatch repair protein [Methanococcoides methylutens]|uniref:DNA mismatch repair protein MutL n=1 Tax=Methanococcoides methylutens TaxID=2226 RepID=A0A099SZY7_METMT|nr:DNA mismatch repair endonuclease MutL [Methanococcoides methylutens]KGK98470.1 DNA mismatch repair protein [Methanococcoides methylutens]